MRTAYIVFFIFVSMGCYLIGATVQGNSTLGTAEVGYLSGVLTSSAQIGGVALAVRNVPILGGIVSGVALLFGFLDGMWKILWWNYPFLVGQWEYLKFLIFYPMSAGFIVSVASMVWGVHSS